jgi:hypothetical protein
MRDHLLSSTVTSMGQSFFILLYVRRGLDRMADAPHRFLKIVRALRARARPRAPGGRPFI